MQSYRVESWYWIIGTNTSQAWSSAGMKFVVTATDVDYQNWIAAGNSPTIIGAGADLAQVMINQALPALMAQGVPLTSASTPSLNGTYELGISTLNTITGLSTKFAAGRPVPGGGLTFNYADASGAPHAFTAANFMNFADAIVDLIYNFEQAIGIITAGGTATMPALSLTIA